VSRPADDAVAVIGTAFELPHCPDWESLIDVFRTGRDCCGPIPSARAAETAVTPGATQQEGGWIDHVTGFDHRYFGMSLGDAELVDPRQRRLLHLAVLAVGDAGYDPCELRGHDVAVLTAAYSAEPALRDLLPEPARASGPAIVGSMAAYAAGRIAYHLDLRGPAMVIDTACSSFLVALHEARRALANGGHELALVGGYELTLGPPPHRATGQDGLGVWSPSGRCRPFDALADGTTFAEGGGFVVLKRLRAAHEDGDTVRAIIRGSAVNQDAGRRNGLTAPSPRGQAEVIAAAWRNAGVTPSEIDYIEAHGTGTRIGDPIEIEGIRQAMAAWPGERRPCRVSSAKGNFGHADHMAGFVGLLRVLAQFRTGQFFPTAHFRAPNPLADLAGAELRVADELAPWPDDGTPRIAGVSSFGLTGTNAHVVLEVARPPDRPPGTAEVAAVLSAGGEIGSWTGAAEVAVVLSARSEAGLRAQVAGLRSVAAAAEADLAAAAHTLACGREHFRYRAGWHVRDWAELSRHLEHVPAPVAATTPPRHVTLLMTGTAAATTGELLRWARAYLGFACVVGEARRLWPGGSWSAAQRCLLRFAGLRRLLADLDVRPALVVADGIGAVASAWCEGTISLATAGERAAAAAGFDRHAQPPDDTTPVDLSPGTCTPANLLRLLHLSGFDLDWRAALGPPPSRPELPVAPLLADPCWPDTTAEDRPHDDAPTPLSPADEMVGSRPDDRASGAGDTVAVVLAIAEAVLREPNLAPHDDFFDVGGDSLNGLQFTSRLNRRFGVALDVLDLFEYATFASLAAAVDAATTRSAEDPPPTEGPVVAATDRPPAGTATEGPLSGQQLAMWAACRLAPESSAYHVPSAFLFADPVSPEWLRERVDLLVRRHPMLRCTVRDGPDGPRQVVRSAESATVHVEPVDLDLTVVRSAAGRPRLLAGLRELVARPLSPYERPVRAQLVRVRFADREQQVLVLTVHHLFCDGWSWRVIFAELADGAPRPAPVRSYLDYVRDQSAMLAGDRGRELTRFWSDYLAADPPPLPTDFDRDLTVPSRGAAVQLVIDFDVLGGVRLVARRHRATVHVVLLAAWTVLLWQLTGGETHRVAVPFLGRRPDEEDIVGCFVNNILVSVTLRPSGTFGDLVVAVRDAQLAAMRHADLPTNRLVRLASKDSARLVASTGFGVQTGVEPITRFGAHGPAVELLDIDSTEPSFLVNVGVVEYGERILGQVKYADELFRPDTIARWLDDYRSLLRRVAAGTDQTLVTLVDPAPVPDFRF
jgi:3-oxoacyl-(acyl-carrier-protein) synthase/acyl carrier protein